MLGQHRARRRSTCRRSRGLAERPASTLVKPAEARRSHAASAGAACQRSANSLGPLAVVVSVVSTAARRRRRSCRAACRHQRLAGCAIRRACSRARRRRRPHADAVGGLPGHNPAAAALPKPQPCRSTAMAIHHVAHRQRRRAMVPSRTRVASPSLSRYSTTNSPRRCGEGLELSMSLEKPTACQVSVSLHRTLLQSCIAGWREQSRR